jgi:hypothetical protein
MPEDDGREQEVVGNMPSLAPSTVWDFREFIIG